MFEKTFVIEASMALFKAEASLTLFTKIINMISDYAEITFEFRDENYFIETSIIHKEEKGSRHTVVIKGRPLVCKYVLQKLTSNFDPNDFDYQDQIDNGRHNVIEVIRKKVKGIQVGNNYAVIEEAKTNWKELVKDLFSKKNTVELSYTGENYHLKKVWFFYTMEKGSKLLITVSGKPYFIKSSIDHLGRFWGLQ